MTPRAAPIIPVPATARQLRAIGTIVTLQDQLMDDLKVAMRAGDEPRREAIRMLRAAVKNEEISRGHTLDDGEVVAGSPPDVSRERLVVLRFLVQAVPVELLLL